MHAKAVCRNILLLLAAAILMPMPVSANINTTVDGNLFTNGEINVIGNSTITGWEAVTVRSALDSSSNHTGLYLLGTGNGDGYVTGTEAKAYADRAVSSGVFKNALDLGILVVSEDGSPLNATLKIMDFPDASGNVTGGSQLNVTFDVMFKAKFKQDKDTHVYSIGVSFINVSYKVKFNAPAGWDIGKVQGLLNTKVVNTDKRSYVTGYALGGGNRVDVEVKKESNWCCLVLSMGMVIGILTVVYFVFQRYRKARENGTSQPEYVENDGKAPPGVQEQPPIERRIQEKERTFGKEYHTEEKGGKDEK